MIPRFWGAFSNKDNIYHIGSNKAEIEKETGNHAAPINKETHDRMDDFLPYFPDIVDHDSPIADSEYNFWCE